MQNAGHRVASSIWSRSARIALSTDGIAILSGASPAVNRLRADHALVVRQRSMAAMQRQQLHEAQQKGDMD